MDLHIDRKAGIREERRVLHIDKNARFRAERAEGLFSKKIYHFHYEQESRNIQSIVSWTKEQYRSLLAQQAKDPIPLIAETTSGRTWWMYRGKFYWEDFSAREVIERQRVKLDVLKEKKRIFLEETDFAGGITKNLWYFHCELQTENTAESTIDRKTI